MFEYEWTCRWGHVDPAGIAYYPRLVDAMHQAGEAFVTHVGWPYWRNQRDHDFALPIAEVGVEFAAPVRVGDVVTIAVDPEVGESSLRFEVVGRREDGTVAFEGFEQHVCVPVGGDESAPLPEAFGEAVRSASP